MEKVVGIKPGRNPNKDVQLLKYCNNCSVEPS
jgi:hypothetical protein